MSAPACLERSFGSRTLPEVYFSKDQTSNYSRLLIPPFLIYVFQLPYIFHHIVDAQGMFFRRMNIFYSNKNSSIRLD